MSVVTMPAMLWSVEAFVLRSIRVAVRLVCDPSSFCYD